MWVVRVSETVNSLMRIPARLLILPSETTVSRELGLSSSQSNPAVIKSDISVPARSCGVLARSELGPKEKA